jgi:hypothetical protein
LSQNWRTEVTFVIILPTANTCPVQRGRAAQTSVSCYTEIPRLPSGTEWSGHDPQGKELLILLLGTSERTTTPNVTRRLYLPFRWHQRDPAKVRNFVSRLLHSAAVSFTSLRCLPAREANGLSTFLRANRQSRGKTRKGSFLRSGSFTQPNIQENSSDQGPIKLISFNSTPPYSSQERCTTGRSFGKKQTDGSIS